MDVRKAHALAKKMNCFHCNEPVLEEGEEATDIADGRLHRECHIRMVAGSLGHQSGLCSCFGGEMEDPPGLSVREAARVAASYFDEHQPAEPDPAQTLAEIGLMFAKALEAMEDNPVPLVVRPLSKPAIICPQCKEDHPGFEVFGPKPEKPTLTCACGHTWTPDPFQNLDLSWERKGIRGSDYYDKNGVPISMGEWARRTEDLKYKQVAVTNFGPIMVSTVWLGMDHGFSRFAPDDADVDRRPVIFESLIFVADPDEKRWPWTANPDKHELAGYQRRYCTLEEAITGHDELVQMVKDQLIPPEAMEWVKQVVTEVNRDVE